MSALPDGYTALQTSGLFLDAWYIAEYAIAGDPLMDFCAQGWRAGRMPNPYFDPAWYLQQNADVNASGSNPLAHYLLDGEAEGRRPIAFFDPVWYRTDQLISVGETCLAHFLARRCTGRVRPVPDFDPARTLRAHPEAVAAGLDPFLLARSGAPDASDRDIIAASGLFDPSFYLLASPDVRIARLDPLAHFCAHGIREGRNPNPYFDTLWYLAQLPTGHAEVNPLVHYYLDGEAEGLPPGRWFAPGWYAQHHLLQPWESPLAHYLAHRRDQRESPNPDFDVAAYMAAFGAYIGPNRDPFMHYLRRHAPLRPPLP